MCVGGHVNNDCPLSKGRSTMSLNGHPDQKSDCINKTQGLHPSTVAIQQKLSQIQLLPDYAAFFALCI